MSKLKLWKPFSLFMVLLLMLSLAAVVPARPVQANVSSITVNPYDTSIIGLNTGYRITMTTGASLSAGDNITIEFPPGTGGLAGISPSNSFINATASQAVGLDVLRVTVTMPAIAPIVPGQQFTVTFNKDCGITNPTTSASPTVTAWTNKEPIHVNSSSYEITAVKVYTGATKHSESATIQAAITAAITGDTITVPAGTFAENLNVDKSLTLQGASSATTIVTAANVSDYVFDVTASGVIISGFTATGATGTGTGAYAGINLQASNRNCNIHDNILTGNEYGILLIEPAGPPLTTVPGNNTFTNNTASGNSVSGIEMQNSYGNTFTNNIANSNGSQGFKLYAARSNTFTGNTANLNGTPGTGSRCGFYLVATNGGCNDNIFTNNTANSNIERDGFRLRGSNHNTFTNNTASSNGRAGIRLDFNCDNTVLTGNNFTSNTQYGIQIDDDGSTPVIDATTLTVSGNNIAGNTLFGINYDNSGGALNAKHNYWGNASGPSHDSLPYGAGVSTGVDFSPWLVSTYTGTPPAGEITITTTSPLLDGTNGVTYSKIFSATGGSGSLTWAPYSGTMPPGLSFTGNNFSGTPTQVKADPGFDFAVQVSDGTQATYKNFLMNVYSGVPVITTTSPLPGGTKNVPYGQTLQATGGTGTYAWSIYTGDLPNGLSLGPTDGKITGTPTATGTFPFNVRVVSGSPGYKDLSITISAAPVGGTRLIGVDTGTASAGGGGGCSNVLIQRFQASATGSITQFRVKTSASGHVKVAIYSDNSSAPGYLLNSVTGTSVSSGWNNITITSTPVIYNTYYWLAVISDACNLYYHSSDPAATVRYKSATYSSWTYPDQPGSGWSTQTGYTYFMAGWAAVTITAPTVTNSPVNNKTQTSATLNGAVGATGGEDPTVIIYWGRTDGGQTANWDHSVNLGTKGAVAFSTNITGLSASTLYYYTCFAANSGGNAWATPSESFTTSVLSAPTVTNASGATLVTATSARLNGAITGTGGQDPTVTIYWGDNDGITNSYAWDNNVNLGTKSAVTFFTDITDLTRGTKYYYRCFGSNSAGSAWAGSSENFTTLAGGVGQLIGVATDTASTGGGGSCTYVVMQRFLASGTGSIIEFKVKASASGNVKVAIYDDSSGSPSALRNAVNTSTPVSAGAWTSIPITSTSVISGTYYWLAVVSDSCNIYYHSSDPSATVRCKPSTYSTWTYPDPAGSGWNTQTGYTYFIAGWSTVILPAPPAPPAIVTPKTTVTFGWAASGGATKYRLQVNTMSDFTGTSMFDAEVSTTSQAMTLTVGTPYYWRVKAGNTGGWSGWSATGSVTP